MCSTLYKRCSCYHSLSMCLLKHNTHNRCMCNRMCEASVRISSSDCVFGHFLICKQQVHHWPPLLHLNLVTVTDRGSSCPVFTWNTSAGEVSLLSWIRAFGVSCISKGWKRKEAAKEKEDTCGKDCLTAPCCRKSWVWIQVRQNRRQSRTGATCTFVCRGMHTHIMHFF